MASLPRAQSPLADRGGYPTREWYAFWAGLQAGTADAGLQQQIDAILAQIAALESADGPTLEQGVGIQIVGILANGYARVQLAQLADSGVGDALVKITRDVYGRIAGMEAATAADLPYDNATSGLAATEVQAAIDELASSGGGGDFIDLDDVPASYVGAAGQLVKVKATEDGLEFAPGSGVTAAWGDLTGTLSDQTDLQAALDGKATSAQGALADSAVQSVVAGTGISVDSTDPQNPVVSATGGGGSGAVLQVARTESSATAVTTSTGIPADNTIPQNTEGDAFTTLDTTITPLSASSTLMVTVSIPFVSCSATTNGIRFCVFRDSDADAVFAANCRPGTTTGQIPVSYTFAVPANSTATTTFTMRIGVNSGTGYINRDGSTTALFGGAMKSSMVVEEVA